MRMRVLLLLSLLACAALPRRRSAESDRPARLRRTACGRGTRRRGEIERLITAGEKPTLQDANSRTPLHVAAHFRHHAAARALLRLGTTPMRSMRNSYDIVTIAAVNNDVEMLKLALAGGTIQGDHRPTRARR